MAPRGYSRLSGAGPGGLLQLPTGHGPFPCALGKQAPTAGVGGVQGEPTALGSCAWVWAALLPLCPTPALSLRSLLREAGTWALYKDGHPFTSLGVTAMPSSLWAAGPLQQVLDSPSPSFAAFPVFVCICLFVLAALRGLWDLSSLTRDRTRAPSSGSTEP